MKKKKILIISIIFVIIALISSICYYILTKEDKVSTLNIIEKQWIEDNKNNIIDLSIVNNIPIFNYNGEGVIFDFINSIESDTGLEFNKISYELGKEVKSDYSFSLVNNIEDNDILIYQDNFVIATSESIKYNELAEIPNMTIGVLSSDLENVNNYLKANSNLNYKSYESVNELIAGLEKDIDGIVLPKTIYLEYIIGNDLNIAYNISDLKVNLVLRLGATDRLNTIITKYYKKWFKSSYTTSFNNYFTQSYYEFNEILDNAKATFKSKVYNYGFISNAPFDKLINGDFVGINKEVISDFSTITGVQVKYKEYSSISSLIEDFNSNKIDIFYNTSNISNFDMDVVDTISNSDEKIVILSNINQTNIVNSIASLTDSKVLVIKDSKISNYLTENNINLKEFSNLDTLLSNLTENSIIALDYSSYEIYSRSSLKNYRIDYLFDLAQNYNFTIRDIEANKVFSNFFNFYLSFSNEQEYNDIINYKSFDKSNKSNMENILIYIGILAIVVLVIWIISKLKKKEKKVNKNLNNVNKENKLKYIDMLTCLKNRNFLNDSMEKWDESEIYPQAIVVIDLNNVAYINDNYGHEEGDNVITEAANILIKSQIEKSEIMRTNGNEFLIYLVEYDEKQVLSFIKKLSKEFKDLAHGFGAAIGYSMITDPIKSVDDAINEATLDMRSNKEEANH
ncbi:MAG: diguanylate cyclase domain-containing protein [Bacilli bacterium]